MYTLKRDDGYTNTLTFQLGVHHRIHLAQIIKKLRRHPSVSKLERVSPENHSKRK